MHEYPGLGLSLRYTGTNKDDFHPIGAHEHCEGAISDLLPVREVAMMNVMEQLTDKHNWHEKVFDDSIVVKWREEALKIPNEELWDLATRGKQQVYNDDGSVTVQTQYSMHGVVPLTGILTETVLDQCISELREKAIYYEKSNIIPTLDACASIAKSDKLVPPSLHEQLQHAFAVLQNDQKASPDWHPRSNNIVQDLVHPSLYPLVYGRSKVLHTESVGVRDAINNWSGRGNVLEYAGSSKKQTQPFDHRRTYVPTEYWSEKYQWLPANVTFQDDGSVKFTSYVNNLHPVKYPDIYQALEKLIETALPAWDQCLVLQTGASHEIVKVGAGRLASRFATSMPEDTDDSNLEIWDPSDPQELANTVVDWDQLRKDRKFFYDPNHDDETQSKWRLLRKPKIPEPIAESILYAPCQPSLAEKFRESGLQIIVKMASIELTPEKPEFPAGSWHIEGQMNEHICATALYYLDSDNITPSHLSFRMQTRPDINQEDDRFMVGQDSYKWLERVYGTTLGSGDSSALQNYGSVETREGRLLAFPNVFQHRVSSFKLIDPTKPGHRRFIALWLVDPNLRIVSTANVPPQQRDWWAEAVLGSTPEQRADAFSKIPPDVLSLIENDSENSPSSNATPTAGVQEGKLPAELAEIVGQYFRAEPDGSLMGREEAEEHRLGLMTERSRVGRMLEDMWQAHAYSFCEH